jgi:hypothetical protein
MRSPLPTPKYDIVSWDGGISIPPLYKVIEELGFSTTYTERTYRKTPFHRKKKEMIHNHNIHEGLTMVFYGDNPHKIDFFQDGELIYETTGPYYCHVNKEKIIREISLSKLI